LENISFAQVFGKNALSEDSFWKESPSMRKIRFAMLTKNRQWE